MTGIDYFTWFVLIMIAATLIIGFVVLAQLPGKMAAANNHPQAAAINMAGWLGLIFTVGIVWIVAMIKIGQYGPGASWVYSHMDPEQAIEAHIAVKARRMLPVSWATFNIAFHDWDEPIKRAVQSADKDNVKLVTPRVGDIVMAGQRFESISWWEEVEKLAD